MFFFKKKKQYNIKNTGGYIAYYNLYEWWLNELTEDERNIIKSVYNPISTSNETSGIDTGNIVSSTQSKLSFLGCLASWFSKREYYNIAKKILIEGEKNIDCNNGVLDKHFFYLSGIKIHYSNRENDIEGLNCTIDYCKKQISISKESKKAFLKEYPNSPLPSHTGYKQLAIIYEKQKDYIKALELTRQALLENWNEDSIRRIERLEKKIEKI